ncbi:cysteine--tRNA ligase [Nesterenkonia ebinurensis]|uniref:cysteine--tRNA ligase n=1 Tax=Nesterenkonia ebinurensis TaxID=2608252 RepID=UPI00123CF0EF|nr:cysteine--tRNA ligase [Nesterenkonia ebinurensis]
MALRLYDTKTAQLREFQPLEPGKVSLYYCGATVQGRPHVGHVRSAVAFDILARWLQHRGYQVTTVRNVTDIDDKILEKSGASYAEGFEPTEDYPAADPWFALAYRFEQIFNAAYDAVGVVRPSYEPRATGHITEMHALITRLIETGHAYPALDDSGDVYFDVHSWERYGELTHQSVDDMQDAPDADPRGKRDPRDFALWKGHKPGEPETAAWDSPWGWGRPGWHLECSAMSTKYLGETFDIHGGGRDLRFPHHENELAQSAAAGDGFARYWLHNGMVTYAAEKMSKSVGNTVSPDQMLTEAGPKAVRYWLASAHYRSELDYKPGALQEAESALERIENFLDRALPETDTAVASAELPSDFVEAMDDDLNVPAALAVLHQTVRAGNTALNSNDDAAAALAAQVHQMLQVLGINDVPEPAGADSGPTAEALSHLVEAQLAQRAEAKQAKDFARADAIRDQLATIGIQVEDTPSGAVWTLKGGA